MDADHAIGVRRLDRSQRPRWGVDQPVIKPISTAETRPLRHRVLRPGQPFGQTAYPRDDHPETMHFGAFDGDRLVGVVSIYREARPDRRTGRRGGSAGWPPSPTCGAVASAPP